MSVARCGPQIGYAARFEADDDCVRDQRRHRRCNPSHIGFNVQCVRSFVPATTWDVTYRSEHQRRVEGKMGDSHLQETLLN